MEEKEKGEITEKSYVNSSVGERIKAWLKKKNNLIFISVLIFSIALRLYYFFLTKNQPLWWDEADYMAYAKKIAGLNVFWNISPQHQSLFPYIAAFFFKLGLSELWIKFFIELLPSIILIFLIYKICLLMYHDKRIAIITTFLISTFWELLFNNMRFHLESLALLTGFLAVYVFFKGYEKKEKFFLKIQPKFAMVVTMLLIIITYSFRRAYFIFGIFILIYMLFTKKIKELVKDKYNWIALIIGIGFFFIVENIIFKNSISSVAQTYFNKAPFNLMPFQVFASYFVNIFNTKLSILLYLFWLGLILLIIRCIFSFGYFRKPENKTIRNDFFNLIMIFVMLSYFLFIQKRTDNFGEPRWYYPLLLGSLICISKGALFITDYIKKYSKQISVIILILLIGYGGYYELRHADMIIKDKINSFNGIKQAGLFLKDISNKDDIIVSVPETQAAYYAERKVLGPDDVLNKSDITLEEFINAIKKDENKKIRYVIVTFSEPNHPTWMRQDEYFTDPQTGQVGFSNIKIPFMNTTIDITNQKQDIKQSVSYQTITFNLLTIKDDAFVYEIKRSN